jgi:hypothetical protein
VHVLPAPGRGNASQHHQRDGRKSPCGFVTAAWPAVKRCERPQATPPRQGGGAPAGSARGKCRLQWERRRQRRSVTGADFGPFGGISGFVRRALHRGLARSVFTADWKTTDLPAAVNRRKPCAVSRREP